MPDPNRQLTRAVVEIATQARRIADALTTPVVEHVDAEQTTDDDARAKQMADLRLRAEIATGELRTLRAGIRALGGDPTTIQNLWAQLRLRNRQWRETKLERDTLRGWLDGDSLQVIDEMVSYHARLSEQRQAAEQQRDQYEQEAVAATQHVLELKATIGRVRDVLAWLGRNYPGFTEPASRLFVALQPQPAAEEQRATQ